MTLLRFFRCRHYPECGKKGDPYCENHGRYYGAKIDAWCKMEKEGKKDTRPRVRKAHMAFLKDLDERPLRINVEPTNICNANCSFCAKKYMKRKLGVMDFDTYKDILRQAKDMRIPQLKLTPLIGDPLMDPMIIDKIMYAKSLKCFEKIYFVTNLINLQDSAEALIKSGIDDITVSTCLQGREDYRRIYGVDAYDKMLTNLKALLDANNRHGKPVEIKVSLRHDAGFDLKKTCIDELPIERDRIDVMEIYDNWGGSISQKDLPSGTSFRDPGDMRIPCSQIYTGPYVSHTGDVGVCRCRDYELVLKIGNIREQSLKDIWHGEKFRRLKQAWWDGNIPPFCRNCYTYDSLYKNTLVIQHARSKDPLLKIERGIRRAIIYAGKAAGKEL